MKTLWLRLKILFTFPSGRRKALRSKYFSGGGKINPAAYGNNKIIFRRPDGSEKICEDWYVPGVEFKITGKNNTVIFEGEPDFSEVIFFIEGDGNFVHIGPTKGHIGSLFVFMGTGARLEIGKNFSCEHGSRFWVGDGQITIGDDCMFGMEIRLRADDAHPYRRPDGTLYKDPGHVRIGNHVWLGEQTYCLKRAEVAPNSIVGARSMVTKPFTQPNAVLAGHPARVVKIHQDIWQY